MRRQPLVGQRGARLAGGASVTSEDVRDAPATEGLATRIHEGLRRAGIPTQYDDSGSIGKRYRRQDETGTPFCITVDGQSGQDQTVTVRDRDSLQQVRISIDSIEEYLLERIR